MENLNCNFKFGEGNDDFREILFKKSSNRNRHLISRLINQYNFKSNEIVIFEF